MSNLRSIVVLCMGAVALSSTLSQGAVPTEVNYQGALYKSDVPHDGTADMKFAIVSGGLNIWTNDGSALGSSSEPTQHVNDVEVTHGIFNLQLGASPMTPLTASAVEGVSDAVLRVWVDTDEGGTFEQLSDVPVSSAVFALHSESAASGVGGGAGLWTEGAGTDIYRLDGRVGIGTDSPVEELHVTGNAALLNLEGSSHGYVNFYPQGISEGRKAWMGFGSSGTETFQFKNETAGDFVFALGAGGSTGLYLSASQGGMRLEPAADVSALNPGGSSGAARITNRALNHLVIDIEANDGGDSFAIRTDANTDGTVDKIAMVVKPSGRVGIGNTNPAAELDVSGTIRTGVLSITGGSDLAEPFEIAGDDEIDPGSVVVIDARRSGELELSSRAYDRRVAGVVSGAGGVNPGLTLSQTGVMDGEQNVALTGRVYVRATAANGPIEPGDLLTTSGVPGHAMKVTDPSRAFGATLGKAMSRLDEGTGLVLLLVNLH